MALIKKIVFTDNYLRITGVDVNYVKKILRIRVDVLKDVATKEGIGMDQQYTVNLKTLINASEGEAGRAVSPKSIKKISECNIEAAEADLEEGKVLDGKTKKEIQEKTKHALVAEKKREIGKNKMDKIFSDIDKKGLRGVAYDCLKLLTVLKGAQDA